MVSTTPLSGESAVDPDPWPQEEFVQRLGELAARVDQSADLDWATAAELVAGMTAQVRELRREMHSRAADTLAKSDRICADLIATSAQFAVRLHEAGPIAVDQLLDEADQLLTASQASQSWLRRALHAEDAENAGDGQGRDWYDRVVAS